MAKKKFLFIVGAPKAGTTSLAKWLGSRPDMEFCAGKEPRHFTDFDQYEWSGPGSDHFVSSMITDKEEYLSGLASPEAEWGIDASTDYLWNEASVGRLEDWSKEHHCKFICILRDPIERALSEYQHTLRDNLDTVSFLESLEKEDERFKERWHPVFYHRRRSIYHASVTKYAETFKEDFLLLDHRELYDADVCLKKVEGFLDIVAHTPPKTEKENSSYVYRNRALSGLMNNTALLNVVRGAVPKSIRSKARGQIVAKLTDKFEPTDQDIAAIRELLADDIKKCCEDSLFPTEGWKTANA